MASGEFYDEILNHEVRKSIQNVNYSQWERNNRRKPSDDKKNLSTSNLKPGSAKYASLKSNLNRTEKNCSSFCNHAGGHNNNNVPVLGRKSRKQLLKEEENIRLLKLKIIHRKEELKALNQREKDLTENNLVLKDFIENTENNAHESVDGILRKYEKFQNVLTIMSKKHVKDLEEEKKDLERVKKEINMEIPIHRECLNEVQKELDSTQELHKLLSIYRYQEYPEKLLQIKNLQKQIIDLKNVNEEEKDDLNDIINKETTRLRNIQSEKQLELADKIKDQAAKQMHESLRDMAQHNESMKEEKVFHTNLIEKLKEEIRILENEITVLLKDERRHIRKMMFPEFYKSKTICQPDDEIILDIPRNKI